MALSDKSKSVIKVSTLMTNLLLTGTVAPPPISLDPKQLIEDLVTGKSKGTSTAKDIAANRQEAEQYLAGLLGMM